MSKILGVLKLDVAFATSGDARVRSVFVGLPNAPRQVVLIPVRQDGTRKETVRSKRCDISAALQFPNWFDREGVIDWLNDQRDQGFVEIGVFALDLPTTSQGG